MRMRTAAPEPNLEDRDALVLAHVDLVRALASRLGRRIPPHVDMSELVSVGVVGLIDAATRYQPSLGVPFDAFARRRINGAMLDALRDLDWVPRSVRRLQRSLEDALTRLRHQLGNEPADEQIAAALGLSHERYERMLDDLRWTDLSLVRASARDDEGDGLDLAVDPDEGPHASLERSELKGRLTWALGEIPERERQILALYYQQDLTLAEIGAVIGVGESRVSQLRTQAIARLRSLLREWVARPAA